MIAELAAQEWPGYVYQVMLSRKWYAEYFPQLKSAFEEKTASVPDDLFIRDDFTVVKVVQGVPLVTDRTGSSRVRRHGDACIAKVMAHYAELQSYEAGYQPYAYEPVKTRTTFGLKGVDPWDGWDD